MATTTHYGLLRSSCSLGHTQIACKGDFIALPLTKAIVGVWLVEELSSKPLQLSGHRKTVTAVCFGHRDHPLLLCSACEDFIFIWNLDKALAGRQVGEDESAFGHPLGKELGHVLHISFNNTDHLISACIGKEVWILNIQTCKLHTLLEGHTADVTQAQFCQQREFIITTISEDRTFKVWNIAESCLIYQSTIISAYSFLCLAIESNGEQMAIGGADGKVQLFDLKEDSRYRCVHELDAGKILQKHLEKKEQSIALPTEAGPALIRSGPSWQFEEQQKPEEVATAVEVNTAVLGMLFCGTEMLQHTTDQGSRQSFAQGFFSPHGDASLKDVFDVPSFLVVGTTSAVIIVNCNTWEPVGILDFQEPLMSSNDLENIQYTISTAGSFAFTQYKPNHVLCLVGTLFQKTAHIISIRIPGTTKENCDNPKAITGRFSQSVAMATSGASCSEDMSGDLRGVECVSHEEPITVLSSAPLCSNSPLKAELVPKSLTKQQPKKSSHKDKWRPGRASPKGAVQDHPLTFNSKVKSSGYTAEPRSKMFSPKTNSTKKPDFLGKSSSTPRCGAQDYPMNAPPPTCLREKISLSDRESPVNNIVYSGDGKQLACALANRTAHVLRTPPTGKHSVLTGHDGAVTSVHFSHSGTWLLTSSTDKTVRLWSPVLYDPLLVLSSVNNNFSSALGATAKSKDNLPFPKEINQARFYYVDKFILLSCGNELYLYKYYVDDHKEDIKRYLTNNKYKLVKSLQQERAQSITAFSSVNGFHSYIVLCTGSNKSIEVFDMNVGRSVRVVLDAHSRPAHVIRQNEGSASVSHPSEAYDLFLTAAVSDGIKLWDLRTNRCVRRYEGHVNRSHPVGVAFSPCSRYIAAGSEDRSAYLYDIRGSTFCHRLTGHTDVVSDVTFHPGFPQLVTASLDGKLRFYSQETLSQ